MKSMIKNRLLLVTAICFLFAGTSCQYDEIVDIPMQHIYITNYQ